MRPDEILETLPPASWRGPFDSALQAKALDALEAGKIIYLPNLPFRIEANENSFLTPGSAGDARKNISFDPATGRVANATLGAARLAQLKSMMERFAHSAQSLVEGLFPGYAPALERARTSFRPDEIAGREYSPRHDDKRLHVDAFPSRPMQGKRILRVFSNVAPDGALRHWRGGETFEAFARSFMPHIAKPLPGSSWLLQRFGVTKSRRTAYDHFMLGLHDGAKMDSAYQATAPRADLQFPAGSTWLCFTDQVLHAALSGHCALEQTFHLPVAALARPETSPLRVLEKIAGRKLA